MIRKKICMVGCYAVGKTSLVRQFVESMFSERYHSTVGVKVDRKEVEVDGGRVNLLLWDMEGPDRAAELRTSYLRGAAGILYVVDGTRRETYDELAGIRDQVAATLGEVPAIVALNKSDLTDAWSLGQDDLDRLGAEGLHHFVTSAKTGSGVEAAFHRLASEMIRS